MAAVGECVPSRQFNRPPPGAAIVRIARAPEFNTSTTEAVWLFYFVATADATNNNNNVKFTRKARSLRPLLELIERLISYVNSRLSLDL